MVISLASMAISWLYRKYIESLAPGRITVLIHIRFFIAVSLASYVCISNMRVVWRFLVSEVNTSLAIITSEVGHISINLAFVLTAAVAVVKIKLTTDFHSIHDKDPQDLARRILGMSVCLAVPPNLVKMCYSLYHQTAAGAMNAYVSGGTKQHGAERNNSIPILLVYGIGLVVAIIWSKLAIHWRKTVQISDSVLVAERQETPSKESRQAYSTQRFLRALGTALPVVALGVAKYAVGDRFSALLDKENSVVLFRLVVTILVLTTESYLVMDSATWLFLGRVWDRHNEACFQRVKQNAWWKGWQKRTTLKVAPLTNAGTVVTNDG